jgi:transposase
LRRSRVPSIVQSDNKNPQLKYDPSYKNKVLSRKSLSAKAIGVHNNTVINWTRRYPEFRHAQLVAEVSSQLPALEEEVSLIEEKILKNETGSKN